MQVLESPVLLKTSSICRWGLFLHSSLFPCRTRLLVQRWSLVELKFRNFHYFFIFVLAVFCMQHTLLNPCTYLCSCIFQNNICIRNKILWSGFFGAVAEFAHMEGNHKVETLATIIFQAGRKAIKSNIGHNCLIDVSLQHPSQDGLLRSSYRALLSLRFVDNLTNDNKN